MYTQPIKGDLDRNLSTILHTAHQKARAERGRLTSNSQLAAWLGARASLARRSAPSTQFTKDAIGQAIPVLRDFAERMHVTATEIAALARPHLVNLGNSVLGQLPPAGFPAEHKRVRAQYALVFQQRLDGALRDLNSGSLEVAA